MPLRRHNQKPRRVRGADAAALRQQLPEKFDADTRLVPIVAAPAESGSYVVKG